MEVLGAVSSAEYTAFSRDVEELIEAFAMYGSTNLATMKEVWQSRGFGFIHEARRPKLEPSRFMQILYSSSCVFLAPEKPLPWRVGALYAIYILYETQEYSPKVRVYLSLENLQWLLSLAQALKQECDRIPLQIIRYMVRDKAFLYGHTCVTLKTVEESKQRRINLINERLRLARSRLLSSVPTDEHISGSLARDLGVDEAANFTFQEYNQAKQRIFQRVNGLEQQQQIDISNEINKISMARDEFRAAYLQEAHAQAQAKAQAQEQAQAQESTIDMPDFEDFDIDMAQFTDDLETFLN